jgi:hypothetical protein
VNASLAAISLALALVQASPSTPSIQVRPSTSNVSIGERFQVTIEAKGPTEAVYEFPREITDGSIELTPSHSPSATADVAIYDAQVFAIGKDVRIPEIEVQYKAADGSTGTAKSTPVPLNVISTIAPSETNPAPADFAPPVSVLVSRAFWIASSAAGLLLLAGIVLLLRRLKFPKKPADPTVLPAISPEEDALTGLDRLAVVQATLDPKAFYIQLVQILKQYLERRLEAPVLEMTSTETLAFVKTHAWTSPHAGAIRDLVSSADLVKFGGSSDASKSERQIQLVRDLVGRIDRLRRAQLEQQAREMDRRKSA